MATSGKIENGKLILTIDLAKEPYVSGSEAKKAVAEKRDPIAAMLASSGGFTRIGDVRVSYNVMK